MTTVQDQRMTTIQNPADRELCRLVHTGGYKLIVLHQDLCDTGEFNRVGPKGEQAVFPGITARIGVFNTTIFITPPEVTMEPRD